MVAWLLIIYRRIKMKIERRKGSRGFPLRNRRRLSRPRGGGIRVKTTDMRRWNMNQQG